MMCPYSGLSPLLSLLCKSLLNHGLERKHVHTVCIFMTKLLLEYKFCFRVALQLLWCYSINDYFKKINQNFKVLFILTQILKGLDIRINFNGY
jgi:hypothetical protein